MEVKEDEDGSQRPRGGEEGGELTCRGRRQTTGRSPPQCQARGSAPCSACGCRACSPPEPHVAPLPPARARCFSPLLSAGCCSPYSPDPDGSQLSCQAVTSDHASAAANSHTQLMRVLGALTLAMSSLRACSCVFSTTACCCCIFAMLARSTCTSDVAFRSCMRSCRTCTHVVDARRAELWQASALDSRIPGRLSTQKCSVQLRWDW